MQRRTKTLLTIFSVGIIVILVTTVYTANVSLFEGQGAEFYSWDASNYDPERAEPRDKSFSMFQKTSATIDPDGDFELDWFKTYGAITALKLDLSQPEPVNFEGNQYQVTMQDNWKPSESWEVEISGVNHKIDIYRMIFGVTVTTMPSNSRYAINELSPIQDFKLQIRINLPQWKGTTPADLGILAIKIPREPEVEGTALSPPILIEVLGERNRGLMDQISTLGFNLKTMPSMSPMTPGTYLYGQPVSTGTNPLGAPDTVDIRLEWASIQPGTEQVSILQVARLDVSSTIRIAVLFSAARPLYVGSGIPGQDPGVIPEEEPACGFFEKPIRDDVGRVTYCEKDTMMVTIALLVGGLVIVIVLAILLKRR